MRDQQQQSLVGAVWTKIVNIVEILFLVGALVFVFHFLVSLVMLICLLERFYTPPPWLWMEFKILVYLLVPLIWFRLLAVVSTYRLRLSQKKHYTYVFVCSLASLVLALNLRAWYSNAAFPLLCITYTVQWLLDARLAPRRRQKRSSRPASRPSVPQPQKNHSQLKLQQMAFSRQETTKCVKQIKQIGSYAPLPPSQKVGIWHSQADENFAQRLRTHLKPKIRQGAIELWDASQIRPGMLWQEERTKAVQSAAVVVLLVSADFMACDFIACHELPQLLYRAMSQGTIILLLHISPCDITGSGLERFHPLNSPDRPLAKLERPDRDKILAQVTHIIYQRLGICL